METPIVDFLSPVTLPYCNFRTACIFIITFGDHMTTIFDGAAMLLSVCVVVSLGQDQCHGVLLLKYAPLCITVGKNISYRFIITTSDIVKSVRMRTE